MLFIHHWAKKKEWRKSLNKNGRDQILWARETEHPLTQILVFTETAERHNLVEVKVFRKWRSRLSEAEIAEFLTKTERAKSMNTQNILRDECCILVGCYPPRPSPSVDNILLPQSA